jgi:hypothetical protein
LGAWLVALQAARDRRQGANPTSPLAPKAHPVDNPLLATQRMAEEPGG